MIGVIYKYTSPSGKVYIGQTRHENDRKIQHRLRAKYGFSGAFTSAIIKYGFENFAYEVLEQVEADSKDELKAKLNALEIKYIAQYNSFNRDYGYNLTAGGEGALGTTMSMALKEKLSEERKGEGNPMFGKKLSNETISKISGENHHNYGKHHSEEIRKKIGLSNKGKARSEETKRHIREAWVHRDRATCNTKPMHTYATWILPDGSERVMKKCHVKRFHKDWIMKEELNNNTPIWANEQPHREEEA